MRGRHTPYRNRSPHPNLPACYHLSIKHATALLLLLALAACAHAPSPRDSSPFLLVLGIAQDGSYPQAGCNRPDCIDAWHDLSKRHLVASAAIVDPLTHQRWLIDATPDFPAQLRALDEAAPASSKPGLDGILLTHAHIGHYLGLAQLGREVIGAHDVRVFAMPRMQAFLEHNGPWDQLVKLHNIAIEPLHDAIETKLNERISVTPIIVPHRDEYSETVAYIIKGPQHSALWLPDIDKWEKWSVPLESVLAQVDVAYVDGTFYDAAELPGRDMSEIPHPFVVETMKRLASSPLRSKIRFIHLNQSNLALRDRSVLSAIRNSGFDVARQGERFAL